MDSNWDSNWDTSSKLILIKWLSWGIQTTAHKDSSLTTRYPAEYLPKYITVPVLNLRSTTIRFYGFKSKPNMTECLGATAVQSPPHPRGPEGQHQWERLSSTLYCTRHYLVSLACCRAHTWCPHAGRGAVPTPLLPTS